MQAVSLMVCLAKQKRGTAVRLLAALLLLGGAGACASGRSFDGVEYRDDQVAFRLGPLPPGFKEVSSTETRLTFQNDSIGASLAVHARCGVDGDDVPLRALVQHLFLQFTEREVLEEKFFRLDGREAVEVELQAAIDGVPRHFIVAVLKKDGCVYDFIHVDRGGAHSELQESRAAFRQFVAGFRVL